MSAEAAPAAATTPSTATPPAPNTAPTATGAGPRQGLLASMVAPVEPARTTFTLNPQAAAPGTPEGGTNMPPEGVSSAAFHDTTTPDNTKTNAPSGNGAGNPKQGMIRALVLAAATRWAKGGGTANKRLDMHKARAQADQVKETRQVTVNRTPAGGPGGGAGAKGTGGGGGRSPKSSGSTGAGGGQGGKSLDRKSSGGSTKNSGSTGPKNNTTHTKPSNGPAGSTKNSNARGPSGAGPAGRGNTGSGHGGGGTSKPGGGKDTHRGRTDTGTTTPKPTKTKDTTAAAPKNSTKPSPGGSTTGAKGSTGGAGKPGKDGKTPPTPKTPTDTTNGKNTPAGPRIPKQTTNDKTPGDTSKTPKPDSKTKPDLTKKKDQEPKNPTKGTETPAKPTPATKDTGTQTKPDSPTAPTAGPTKQPLATQPSRETGYRDGTRAAKATAHARAYRDGVKDGWADTLAAANHEKTLLDQAHADRKKTRKDPAMSNGKVVEYDPSTGFHPVSADGSNGVRIVIDGPNSEGLDRSANRPQPINVKRVDSKNVHLGAGANRTTISRGEVRSLKQYERRLEDRLATLQKTADTTKQLQAHAEGQAQQAQKLLDQAKGVKGGSKLTGTLSRLAENAKKQATEAGEIHKRAVRSADACKAVLSNVTTRYGGMYQAVVDSPETIPAELAYYQGA
ncbi:hypothetical protein [Streptomyces rubiginosohelvolus]|uniref:Uncharacterized protein n=1 Tax=Streptomyces rubiginosohelvolus TaxID=67362 RepID=A0ABQ3CB88_9ACTN|nr:hypothetical protein [Streptomyces pluricolorescens]GGZ82678.1 hypothetical protein GCM10010328_66370 [Streptomyces pluricolorescens]